MLKNIGCILLLIVNTTVISQLRLVTVGYSITEIVNELGYATNIVAIDDASREIIDSHSPILLGYQRNLTAEAILSASPDIVITTNEAGPFSVWQQIEKAGVDVLILPVSDSMDALQVQIKTIAELLEQITLGETLWQHINNDVNNIIENNDQQLTPMKVLFVLSVASRTPMVAGYGTVVDKLINLSGAVNVAQHFSGYHILSNEVMYQLNPDILLFTHDGLAAMGGIEKLKQHNGLKQTNAVKNNRLVTLDSHLLLSMGPHVNVAIRELQQAFYD